MIYAQIHMYSKLWFTMKQEIAYARKHRDLADSEINLSCDVEYVA